MKYIITVVFVLFIAFSSQSYSQDQLPYVYSNVDHPESQLNTDSVDIENTMPTRSKRPCTHPGCGKLTIDGRCQKHSFKEVEKQRPNASKRGYGHKWRIVSKQYLQSNPYCVDCLSKDIVKASKVVDHIIPHKGDYDLFWDQDNWQALCKQCHDSKTAKHDGRWGDG